MSEPPITQRFKHRWCFRAKVWFPEGGSHGSMQSEGPLPAGVGEALMIILANTNRFRGNGKLRGALRALADSVIEEAEAEREKARWA